LFGLKIRVSTVRIRPCPLFLPIPTAAKEELSVPKSPLFKQLRLFGFVPASPEATPRQVGFDPASPEATPRQVGFDPASPEATQDKLGLFWHFIGFNWL
jgi:hypothetical protein